MGTAGTGALKAWAPLLLWLFTVPGLASCRLLDSDPAVATAAVGLHVGRVPLGGPLEMTYRFAVAENVPGFAGFTDDYHAIQLPAASFGDEDTVTLTLTVDKTFVPSVRDIDVDGGVLQRPGP